MLFVFELCESMAQSGGKSAGMVLPLTFSSLPSPSTLALLSRPSSLPSFSSRPPKSMTSGGNSINDFPEN